MTLIHSKPSYDLVVYMPTTASVAINPGDLLYTNGTGVLPASSQADALTESANQSVFARNFVGISNGKKLSSDAGTGEIPIIVDKIVKMTCASATFKVGDLVGANEAASGTALENQSVQKVTDPRKAIGRVTRPGTSITEVEFELLTPWNRAATPHAGPLGLVAQTIAMADAAVVLTMETGAPAGTLITGNVLFVDPESGGANENLDLPPEADCNGLVLFIYNTGGEGIIVRDDGGSTIATLLTAEHAIVGCNGTVWKGLVGAET